MVSKTLTPEQAAEIKHTLVLAREGKATLVQLATAHDLANDGSLNGCLGELRLHIKRMVSPPPLHITAKEISVGVMSGLATHLLLRNLG